LISKQLPREIEKEPNPVLLFFFTRVMKFLLQVLKMLSCEDLDSSISLPPHNFLHQFYRVTIWIPTLESIDRKMLKKNHVQSTRVPPPKIEKELAISKFF
jgi:hypothetical protein